SGDPSPHTARGVFRALQASTRYRWNTDDLSGVTVAVQGCGHVGDHLLKMLAKAGAKLIATDVDSERLSRVVDELAVHTVEPSEFSSVRADILAPSAVCGALYHT